LFDKIIRELRKLKGPHQLSISVPLDEKGYYDRKCRSEQCAGRFKVLFDDWRDKVANTRAFCPFCRHEAPADHWNTAQQQRYIESVVEAEASRLLNAALKRGTQQTPPQRIDGGLLSISMSLSYSPGRIPPVIPAMATGELRQDFRCDACGCRYASLGASFFCPACGHNSAESCFDNTLETVRQTIAALPALASMLRQTATPDAARDAVRQVREDQFSRLVGAFERLSEALFDRLPNSSQWARKGNVFQRLDDASALWEEASGKSYGNILNNPELERLKHWFQRRHVLSHGQGIVDQTYIDRSGDRGYAVGQRLVVRDRDVLDFIELLAKLAAGLRELV
jgi:hypothetical protein